jgi:hypothetical protein
MELKASLSSSKIRLLLQFTETTAVSCENNMKYTQHVEV